MPIRFHDYPPSLQIINTVHQLQRGAPQQDQLETVYLPPPRWETDQLSICQELLRSTPQETQHRLWVPEMPLIPLHTPRSRHQHRMTPEAYVTHEWANMMWMTLCFSDQQESIATPKTKTKSRKVPYSQHFFSCLSVMRAVCCVLT